MQPLIWSVCKYLNLKDSAIFSYNAYVLHIRETLQI